MTFTENEILIYFLLGIATLIGLIFAIKANFAQKTIALLEKNEQAIYSIRIKKNPEVNLFQFRNTFFRVGLICSLSSVVLAFNWTLPPEIIDPDLIVLENIDDWDSRYWGYRLPPPPPPAPALIIEIVPNETVLEGIDFENIAFDKDGLFESELFFDQKENNSVRYITAIPPPPIEMEDTFDLYLEEEMEFEEDDFVEEEEVIPPTIQEEEEEEEVIEDIINIVESMPTFPSCENLPTNTKRKRCTEKKLLTFMYKNIRYPAIAKKDSIQGAVAVAFVIDVDSLVKDIEIIKDIGGGCGDEVVRVVLMMNQMPQKWNPIFQGGRAVRRRLVIPIRFRLR